MLILLSMIMILKLELMREVWNLKHILVVLVLLPQLSLYIILGLIEENIISLISRGGNLSVMFEEFNGIYRNIWLTGSVNLVYIGEFEC